MVRIFYKEGKQVKKETDVREIGLLKNLMWVDLQSPTNEEEEWVETKCNISFQTPQEIVEIESSARYFEQNNTINANSNFLIAENDGYSFYPVSFLIRDNILFTFRQGDSKTFADTVKKIRLGEEVFKDGVDILLLLLETRIESDADLLEWMTKEVKSISRTLSREKKPKQDSLITINNLQENTMVIRESIIDKQRVLSQILRSLYFPEDRKERLRIVLKDINSLLEYTTFNFERLEYLQDTFMGLINLEQNEIIKIFTVVTICFLPPTLIAGVFGMNYPLIPTTEHPFGFWIAVILMVISSLGFLWFFKRRRWI
ncbi:magnesium and cobalt transport protein CorA [Emticicia oligotrophica DSM 17448]|uniref:Magnesium transport protein CorA n=1 Tax=Emticicia oligotrophica (strain DSM 17448 / CIP 109782 / MTCC 6937 / GPTSA100-15) TaxID=929562 RepID=A0ABN4AR95_EMTOG|nr:MULTISPECIES: magnesium/cobalt transporter CorA [Emticicia]AFK04794.1 magnesium and cobalt transport protein CorA [Emticicia oligotrophica DSM 17448]